MPGFAVIDLETTGFAYNANDRVCEVAVVLVDPLGRREDAYTTLVNPQRDLGAQHVHRIDARDARVAPTFERIVGDLTGLLDGRTVVAHNSTFDAAFLAAEYVRAGWPVDLTPDVTLCTMRFARSVGAPTKLTDCCQHFGVPLVDAHAALADAEATAALLAAYMHAWPTRDVWEPWLAMGVSVRWPSPPRLGTTPVTRGALAPGSALLASVLGRFEPLGHPESANQYLDLLDRVLADRRIANDERRALSALAATLGLTDEDVAQINRHYMLGVVDAACADNLLTREERALIIQLAGLLDLDNLEVETLLVRAESQASDVGGGVDLKPGDLVVLTGMSEARKRELTAIAEARGLVVWPNVKKGVAAVIAQDENTNSSKARQAREYGIPVVGEGTLAP
jgi:DNA polymerase-3 subunit epsilon